MKEKDPASFLPLHHNWFHILLSLVGAEQHGYGIMQEVLDRTNGTVRIWPATRELESYGKGIKVINEWDYSEDPDIRPRIMKYLVPRKKQWTITAAINPSFEKRVIIDSRL